MDLKDLILSTLEELDNKIEEEGYKEGSEEEIATVSENEREFLLNSKERLEVLFDGLKSDENVKVEEKLELVVNFLHFYLSRIEDRLKACPK